MSRDVLDQIHRYVVRPLERRIENLITLARVSVSKDKGGSELLQYVEGSDEADVFDSDEVTRMQPGGLAHRPLVGATGVMVKLYGDASSGVTIAVSNIDQRPAIDLGETALYNASATQSTITIRANGDVEVSLADGAKLKVGTADQSYVRGEDFYTYLDGVIDAMSAAIGGVPSAGTGLQTTFEAAIAALAALRTASLSATIKGA